MLEGAEARAAAGRVISLATQAAAAWFYSSEGYDIALGGYMSRIRDEIVTHGEALRPLVEAAVLQGGKAGS